MTEFSDECLGPDLAPSSAAALLAAIARTSVQIYNQLRRQGRPSRELLLVRQAYEPSTRSYSGAYQADDKPFVLHVVAVASSVAQFGLLTDFVAAALLHNPYADADFRDGRKRRMCRQRRALGCAAVGDEVETPIRHFAEVRVTAASHNCCIFMTAACAAVGYNEGTQCSRVPCLDP